MNTAAVVSVRQLLAGQCPRRAVSRAWLATTGFVQRLELSGFEIDESEQMLRKRLPSANHGESVSAASRATARRNKREKRRLALELLATLQAAVDACDKCEWVQCREALMLAFALCAA